MLQLFFPPIQLVKCHKEADAYKIKLGWLLFDNTSYVTLFPLNSFIQINTEGSVGTDTQASSRRFFMCCPCLYGLKPSPDQAREWNIYPWDQWSAKSTHEPSPVPWWCRSGCWGLDCPCSCLLLCAAPSPAGLPGPLWGVLLRVCMAWLPGVPGPASLHGILPAAASRSSNLSRVKSQISGSSAEREEAFFIEVHLIWSLWWWSHLTC